MILLREGGRGGIGEAVNIPDRTDREHPLATRNDSFRLESDGSQFLGNQVHGTALDADQAPPLEVRQEPADGLARGANNASNLFMGHVEGHARPFRAGYAMFTRPIQQELRQLENWHPTTVN